MSALPLPSSSTPERLSSTTTTTTPLSKMEQENRDIMHSIFEMNQIMVRAIPSISELVENEKESINCIKPGYEELDEPNPTYTCKDDIQNFELVDLVEKQAKRSLVYLFLPDTRCRTLRVEGNTVTSMIDFAASEQLVDSEGRLTKYKPLYDRLEPYITEASIYHGMVFDLHREDTNYFKSKIEFMEKELGYKGIQQPFVTQSSQENVFCESVSKNYVVKLVETRQELIEVIDCMQETFTSFKSGELTANVMNNIYPLNSDEFAWICIKDDGEVATTGQVFFGPTTCYGSNLCTKPKFRGKGYATLMMVAMIELAKTRKHKYNSFVIQASLDGLSIYSKLGFDYRYDFEILELNPQAKESEEQE
ncbi:hypothetical protein C9374_004971 [Naegleria lovaniensis]|uniref:N-acetyltransferase domain-containing protein n=1 Tax=Naegleria lovaniensis TaxID=51637 RepID=A0AA88GPX6_NAELO|nr:uncharacterized protein C9374_004971 [Naegleria lovaniensis]KAG2383004.1 hypothetical protein C9374_004971 [Naegleria lovaniensis]